MGEGLKKPYYSKLHRHHILDHMELHLAHLGEKELYNLAVGTFERTVRPTNHHPRSTSSRERWILQPPLTVLNPFPE